jgi:hypothetical protein
MFQTYAVGKIRQTHFMFSDIIFRKLCRLLYKVKNIVETGWPRMTVWRMRIACWIPKGTNTITYLLHGAESFLKS